MFFNKTNRDRFAQSFHVVGMLMMIISFTQLTPLTTHFWFTDGDAAPFLLTFLFTFGCGLIFWFPMRNLESNIRARDGFLIVALFWSCFCFFSSIPFMISDQIHISWTDAIFESMSGVTATGTNVFHHLDKIPHDLLFYRQQLQFLGGISIIILAVAILPMLGIGGLQLFRTESSAPIKDNKLTPRIKETAKQIWIIYILLTLLCALFYWLFGMSAFDAICESFATTGTGGFSVHDANFIFYNSNPLKCVAMIFMFLGATNFSLHILAIRYRSLKEYCKDTEFKSYGLIILITGLITMITLLLTQGSGGSMITTFINSLFTTTSILTTTGYNCTQFSAWPLFLPIFMMMLAFIGGCSGSTAGGLKMARITIFFKQIKCEFKRLMHPNAIVPLTFDHQLLPDDVVNAVRSFISLYIVLVMVSILGLMATGLNFTTSFGAIAACISNSGTSIGNVADNFAFIPSVAKWILSFAMLFGRLEIFTILILFFPSYWKQ